MRTSVRHNLAICCLATIVVASIAASAASGQVSVLLPDVSADVDEQLSIPITVSNLDGLEVAGYQFTVTFSSVVIDVTGVESSNTLSSGMFTQSNSPATGQLNVVVAGSNYITGSGTLLLLNVTALGTGTATLSLDDFIFDNANVTASTTSGSVSVVTAPTVAPTLTSPADGVSISETTPTLEWTAVPGATDYDVEVDDNSSFSSPDASVNNSSSISWTVSVNLMSGSWYWRVRASNTAGTGPWSSSRSFTVSIPPRYQPTLISPPDGASMIDTTPLLEWSAVEGTTSYDIEVDNSPSFDSVDRSFSVASPTMATSVSWTVTPDLTSGTWYWHVRASNSAGTSPWSLSRSFTLTVPPTNPPVLTAPELNAQIYDPAPLLSWSSVSGATGYDVEVDDNSSFILAARSVTNRSSTSWTVSPSLILGTWNWRVRATNSAGAGPWSSSRSFSILPVMSPPADAPILISPEEAATTTESTPTLTWVDVTGATGYDVEVDDSALFNSLNASATNHGSTSWAISPSLPAGTWYWRTRARNSAGPGPWSISRSFTITPVILPPTIEPSLTSPLEGVSMSDSTPLLVWTLVTGATGYDIQVDNSLSFSSPNASRTDHSSTSWTVSPSLTLGTWYWRTRARNSGGMGPWSSSRSFIVASGIDIDPEDSVPSTSATYPVYPNPTHSSTYFKFDIPEFMVVSVQLADISGRIVRVLSSRHRSLGNHQLEIGLDGLPSGTYFIILDTQSRRFTRTVMKY